MFKQPHIQKTNAGKILRLKKAEELWTKMGKLTVAI